MCKDIGKHIHIIRENEQVLYTTACPKCFEQLLKNPQALEQLKSKS